MKRIITILIIFVMSIVLASGCSNSGEKQAKSILDQYFQDNKLVLNIDEYKGNGAIEAESLKKNEIIVINDGETTNKLDILEPTPENKSNPTFAVDIEKKEVFRKVALQDDNEKSIYVKVSPRLKYEFVTTAVTEFKNEITPEVKAELTKELESIKNELFEVNSDSLSSSSPSGTTSGSGNTTSSGTTNGSETSSGSGTNTISGTTNESGTTQENGSSTIEEGLPIASVAFYKSLVPGMKIVLVKLNTSNPEKYSVSYGDIGLTYNAEFSGYVGDLPEGIAENLEAVIKKN